MTKVTEIQRIGRNKETVINHGYINSGEYRKKFDLIGNKPELSRILYQLAKKMLIHRTGTKYEDMYWIDLNNFDIFAKEINGTEEKKIIYSIATEQAILQHENIITIHSHPDSFPPSIEDFNSNYDHGYDVGIVICHDGTIYMYSANVRINENYYKLVVEGYVKAGYNDKEAQLKAIEEIKENFDIQFEEVAIHEGI